MKRGTLQFWTLIIWFTGLVTLQVIVLIAATVYRIDTFVIKATDVAAFEDAFAPAESAVKQEGSRKIRVLAAGRIQQRTSGEFRQYLRNGLPSQVEPALLNWLVDNCTENRMAGLQMTFLQIYLPWLAVMIAGLLGNTTEKGVALSKARASISCSVALQILFILFLLNTLLIGDLAATRNIELMATLVTALVGTLVQFVFPAAPEVQGPAAPPSDKESTTQSQP
jgi:hypothetical protein